MVLEHLCRSRHWRYFRLSAHCAFQFACPKNRKQPAGLRITDILFNFQSFFPTVSQKFVAPTYFSPRLVCTWWLRNYSVHVKGRACARMLHHVQLRGVKQSTAWCAPSTAAGGEAPCVSVGVSNQAKDYWRLPCEGRRCCVTFATRTHSAMCVSRTSLRTTRSDFLL